MNKKIAAFAIAALSIGLFQQVAQADDDWFDRHDRDHDHRWNYKEFHTAHNDYYRHHHDEDRWNNTQIKEHWNSLHHDGYVTREEVNTLHHW